LSLLEGTKPRPLGRNTAIPENDRQSARYSEISADNLRLRIKVGKYPDVPHGNGTRRLFTSEHIQKLRAMA